MSCVLLLPATLWWNSYCNLFLRWPEMGLCIAGRLFCPLQCVKCFFNIFIPLVYTYRIKNEYARPCQLLYVQTWTSRKTVESVCGNDSKATFEKQLVSKKMRIRRDVKFLNYILLFSQKYRHVHYFYTGNKLTNTCPYFFILCSINDHILIRFLQCLVFKRSYLPDLSLLITVKITLLLSVS